MEFRKGVSDVTVLIVYLVIMAEPGPPAATVTTVCGHPHALYVQYCMAPTLIDLTQPFDSKLPVYPGDPLFSCRQSHTVPRDGYSVHALSYSSHVGTHVDAPSHFFANGATIDQLPLSTFIVPALVALGIPSSLWPTVSALAPRCSSGRAGAATGTTPPPHPPAPTREDPSTTILTTPGSRRMLRSVCSHAACELWAPTR